MSVLHVTNTENRDEKKPFKIWGDFRFDEDTSCLFLFRNKFPNYLLHVSKKILFVSRDQKEQNNNSKFERNTLLFWRTNT